MEDDLAQPLSGSDATDALNRWNRTRSCTNATAGAGAPMATMATETGLAPAAVVQQLSVDGG
jgi:hypothetical protein